MRRGRFEAPHLGQRVAPLEIVDVHAGEVQCDPLSRVGHRPGCPVHLQSPHLGAAPHGHDYEIGAGPDAAGNLRAGHHGAEPPHTERPIDRQPGQAIVRAPRCDLGQPREDSAQGVDAGAGACGNRHDRHPGQKRPVH